MLSLNFRLCFPVLLCALTGSPSIALAGKVGFGSTTSVASRSFQENVYLGFEAGMHKTLGKEKTDAFVVASQLTDKSPLSATRSAETLLKNGAIGLVGFPTSHDALLAADVARKAGVLSFFAGAAHRDLAKKGPLVYSTGGSMDSLFDSLFIFLKRTFPQKRGLAVVSPFNAFSMNQEATLLEKTKAPDASLPLLDLRRLTKAQVLSNEDLAQVKAKTYDYLYLTLYPEDLPALLSQLTAAKIDLPMVSVSGADPSVLERFLANMKSPFYLGSSYDPRTLAARHLDQQMLKQFKVKANPELGMGYDLGIVVGTILSRVSGPLTKQSFIDAFNKDRCFTGIVRSVDGKVCFPQGGGHIFQGAIFRRFEGKP